MTRTDTDNRDGPALFPEERLTLDEALTAFTLGSAYVNHRDDRNRIHRGRQAGRPGHPGPRHPIAGRRARLGEARVVATLVDGRVVAGEL